MTLNLDSLLAGNQQKNAQKRQEEVVVLDSETETVTEDERNAPKKVDSGSNKSNGNQVTETETANKDNETDAMEVTETETPNKDKNYETNEPNKENETDNEVNKNSEPEDNAMDVNPTENNEPNKENKTDNEANKNSEPEDNAMDVNPTENNEPNKENKTDNEANKSSEPEDNAMDVNPTENEEKQTENAASDNTDTEQNRENKDRKAKPGELKEKDPILEAFCNVQSHKDLEILLADYNKKKLASSKVSETDIKTQNGTVNVKEYGLLKSPIRKDRSLACTECDVKKTTIAELTKHIKEAHPGFKYKCS